MVVQIPLSDNAEAQLRAQASAAGKDIAGFVLEAVEEKLAVLDDSTDTNGHTQLSSADWITRMRRWAASHRVLPHEADDSRESIYADRGE